MFMQLLKTYDTRIGHFSHGTCVDMVRYRYGYGIPQDTIVIYGFLVFYGIGKKEIGQNNKFSSKTLISFI